MYYEIGIEPLGKAFCYALNKSDTHVLLFKPPKMTPQLIYHLYTPTHTPTATLTCLTTFKNLMIIKKASEDIELLSSAD